MCIGMCIGMCIDMCINVCMDMCIDKCTGDTRDGEELNVDAGHDHLEPI